jgi:PAS domain S-box-containing protein
VNESAWYFCSTRVPWRSGLPVTESVASEVKVLVADDDPLICQMTSRILTNEGYLVLTAGDGQQALEASRAHSGPLHLVLSDVKMPRLTGPELCEQVQRERPETIFLLMSGDFAGVPMVGEFPFIAKPFTPAALRLKVRELLHGRMLTAGTPLRDAARLRDGIWTINAEGRTVFANKAMVQMLGTTVSAIIGQCSFDYVFPEDVEAAKRLFEIKRGGDTKSFQFRLRRADGSSVWVEISNTPMFSQSGEFQGIVGLFSEIEAASPARSVA